MHRHKSERPRAITKQKREIQELAEDPPKTINGLLGVEGRAAFAYFLAWQKVSNSMEGSQPPPNSQALASGRTPHIRER
jgi:CRISPR/Cas system-associated endonuclease Cas1